MDQKAKKLPKRKIPIDYDKETQINWEKKYQELLEWVDSGQSGLIEWIKDEEPETEAGDIHLILDFGRKRKKKGRKNSLWESSERRKAKSKPDCCIRIEYRVPKDIATLESEGFDQDDIKSYAKRAHLRPRVISWMKDKGNDGPIRKLVHTVEKKSIAKLTNNTISLAPIVPNTSNSISTFTFPLLNLSTQTSSPLHRALPPTPSFQLKCMKPNIGSPNGNEIIKIFGSNLGDNLKLFWGDEQVEFVCKNDQEIWCGSLVGIPGTTFVVSLKDQNGSSQQLFFTYQNPITISNLETKLKEVEDKLKEIEEGVSNMTMREDSLYSDEIKFCQRLTSEVREDLKKPIENNKLISVKTEQSELERNVAFSLASLSDTFMKGDATTLISETATANSKRTRRMDERTKLLCKKCRYVLCVDCASELQFVRREEELELWTLIQKGWSSLSRRLGTTVEEQSSCTSVQCKACDETVGTEHRINHEPSIKLFCSKILFQDKNGDILGGDSFDSLRGKLPNIPEVVNSRNHKSTTRVPTLQNTYDGNNTDLNDLLKKFYADRQFAFQHAGSKPPSCLSKS